MKKQAGFTLIELVIVIIILGILAVTAAPKFLNLQDDAKKAAADGVKGAVASSAQLVYSRAVLDGNEKDTTGTKTVTLADNTTVTIKYGYPTATSAGIGKAATIDPLWVGSVSGSTYVYQTSGSTCTVVYTEANASGAASTAKSGC
ncbi:MULTISPECIES: prepilin-type N-terminal cleavage/methylation domain-containing protein [Aeromonas]|jgi:MSHA pilin protein MshA|uniref:prepilin-type N-terminal cleavage/methylation domain-containing protein n=1 Tax=Aeromonas TaxID=642 RepID=UPI00059C5400|nr:MULTISPECIES: prepilin-type N-terminal cleavage/methylation domain-containing protein [Aeromonas]MBL0668302.1 prepilin-type N-terminal cleavage/methylation domain-containing protein [Aeromonas jandaei]MBW3762275.1 prepilin-type N-terminal cleavage/methylation domain-containing protein [Aeromonas jandaei]MBW3807786.1 prepilin-type N-terminal cleavage/methylation domain-containing protein [Aeromonas jandaei]MCQ4055642.1 prepilin-type N-terminal cleavage/methylation domain-containing protein [A